MTDEVLSKFQNTLFVFPNKTKLRVGGSFATLQTSIQEIFVFVYVL